MNQTLNNFQDNNAHVTAKFTEQDLPRTKYLINKVSGKFNIDFRYQNINPHDQFKPVEVYK
jgi:hypothetical protein